VSESLTAAAVAEAYAQYTIGAGDALLGMMAEDFHDHVSGRTGREIWSVVAGWLEESFSDRTCEVTAALADGDRIVVWFVPTVSMSGAGSRGFVAGRLRAGTWRGRRSTCFVSRMGCFAHWAVRDDLRVLEAIDAQEES
jgi:hypothetical protein